MSKTRDDIHRKVIAILAGGDVGFDVSEEDAETIDGYIDSAVAKLAVRKAAYIADADDLAEELFMAFCKYVANDAADEFGGKPDEAKGRFYENELRKLTAEEPGFGPQKVCFF